MWFIQPKRDYVAELPWQHADEPALMAWQIRTRNYNTFAANVGFFIWLSGFAIFMYFLITKAVGVKLTDGIGLALIGVFFLFIPIGMSIFFQTSICVYRLTSHRIEVISWKPQIDSVKPVLTWTAILSGVGVLFLVLVNSAFLVAAIGPVGIGVAAALMGTSKNYQKTVRNELNYELSWQNAKKIYVFRRRNIIGLNIHWYNPDVDKVITTAIRPVFCRKGELDNCLDYFKQRLPDVPIVEESFDVYH